MENHDAPPSQVVPVFMGIPGLGLLKKPTVQKQSEQSVLIEENATSSEDVKTSDHQVQNTLPVQDTAGSPPESPPSLISALEARLGITPVKTESESAGELAARETVILSPDVIKNVVVNAQVSADAAMADVRSVVSGEAEFEVDSSPYQSSSDDSSDDSSSSENSDGGDGYALLSPEEQARILMQDDGGSDDEGAKKSSGGHLRTKNEVPEEVIPKPDVAVTPEMKIIELGPVESIVENIALIKAKVSGEYQVLESSSVLCLEDRSVIGVVSDTLGPVQQPLYCVRFTNPAEITTAGVTVGTKIFYVESHSTYVFTQALKAMKGTDASNIYDEEVGIDELEFSDDEKEMEHKRRIKQQKSDRRYGNNDGGSGRGGYKGPPSKRWQESRSNDNGSNLNYDDIDGPYKTLARPSSFAENVIRPEAPQENQSGRYYSQTSPGEHNAVQSSGGGRGRDDRGRGRGRGDRGRGRNSDRGGRSYHDRQNGNQGGHSLPSKPQESSSLPTYYPPDNSYGSYNQQPQQQPQSQQLPPQFFPPVWSQPSYSPLPFSGAGQQSQFPFQGMPQQLQWAQMPPGGAPQLSSGTFFNPAFFGVQAPNPWGQTPPKDEPNRNGS